LWGLHPNDIFFETPKWKFQNWDFYCFETLDIHIFPKSSLFGTCKEISYSLQNHLSNGVLHAPIGDDLTLVLKGLMIESQIGIDLSFDHNSCILGLNG
jgi:hypothetical protein